MRQPRPQTCGRPLQRGPLTARSVPENRGYSRDARELVCLDRSDRLMTFLSASPPPPIDEISDVVPLAQGLWRFCAEYVLGTRLEVLVHSASHASAKLAVHAARAECPKRLSLIHISEPT